MRGEVAAAVAGDAVPEDAVEGVIARGEVLDRDGVGEDVEPVGTDELAIDDDRVAVHAADHERRRGDRHLLGVRPAVHEHEVAGGGGIDGGLDRRILRGHGAGDAARRGDRRRPALGATAVGGIADDDGTRHPAPVLGPMVRAVELVDAALGERELRLRARCDGARVEPGRPSGRIDRHDVVRVAADVGHGDAGAGGDPHDGRDEGVVMHLHLRRALSGGIAGRGHDDRAGHEDSERSGEAHAANLAATRHPVHRSRAGMAGRTVGPGANPRAPRGDQSSIPPPLPAHDT